MTNKAWQERVKGSSNDGKGYCMIEAMSKKGDEKFINFYAVPTHMKEDVLSNNALLMKSADVKNMYKVNLEKYNNDIEGHCKKAEDVFSSYVSYQNKSATSR